MSKNADSERDKPVLEGRGHDDQLHSRVFRTMIATTVLAVLWAVLFSSREVAIGLLIGGILAVLNHRWLQTSIRAAFGVLVDGRKPQFGLSKYIFRYLIVASVAVAAYTFAIASLMAILAGLSTFVVALFVEALREMYFAIMHREETT